MGTMLILINVGAGGLGRDRGVRRGCERVSEREWVIEQDKRRERERERW